MSYKSWTKEDLQFIMDNYKHGRRFCAEKLGRSIHSVKGKANELKLRSDNAKDCRRWEDSEVTFMMEWYVKKGAKYCADQLGRSMSAVASQAHFLELRSSKSIRHDLAIVENIFEEFCHKTTRQIAKERGLSKSSVDGIIRRAKARHVKKRKPAA